MGGDTCKQETRKVTPKRQPDVPSRQRLELDGDGRRRGLADPALGVAGAGVVLLDEADAGFGLGECLGHVVGGFVVRDLCEAAELHRDAAGVLEPVHRHALCGVFAAGGQLDARAERCRIDVALEVAGALQRACGEVDALFDGDRELAGRARGALASAAARIAG